MRDYLKQAADGTAQSHRAVEERVRAMLAEIRDGGDERVRAFARELYRWEDDFRVPEEGIRAVARSLPETFKEDFAFCKAQVEGFAHAQRDSLQAFEVELAARHLLGQKLIPVSPSAATSRRQVSAHLRRHHVRSRRLVRPGVERSSAARRPAERTASTRIRCTRCATQAPRAIYYIGGVQAMAAMAYGCVGMPQST